jgi:FkbH-like protein
MNREKEIKCVIWDLDNTLWDGILSESDIVKLKPGIVEIIKELDKRGVLHSVASKNNYVDAYSKLCEFGIEEYFLYPQINWNSKSSSIFTIHNKLNLSIDSFLFIDDQAFELDEVKSIHPQIECYEADNYEKLLSLDILNPRFITTDSKKRRIMYQNDIKRNEVEQAYKGTSIDFLKSLDMEFVISKAKEEDLKRAEELTIRTNQLNATGITYDYEELNKFRLSDRHLLLVVELEDKYGSYGKIGLCLVEVYHDKWVINLLLMSCRVMSRGVGTIFLTYVMNLAKHAGKKLFANFKQTERNRQMYIMYKFAGFKDFCVNNEYLVMEKDLSNIPKYPEYIKIKVL